MRKENKSSSYKINLPGSIKPETTKWYLPFKKSQKTNNIK